MLGVARPVAVGSAARGPLRALARLWRWLFPHPLALVLSTTILLLFVALGLVMGRATTVSITDMVVAEKIEENRVTTGYIVGRYLSPEDLAAPMTGERHDRLNTFLREYILNERVVRLKIWDRQGTVIYSDDRSQMGRRYLIEEDLAMALAGRSSGHVSD
ncbi:MAG TPA: hypothetical protein VJM69_00450, partial [Dehalococcoidia bacterium]|nr:hypothetical protein [Dehalococcoidia bacterium]